MNDKREIFGWTMYDWANSAFSTTVVTALIGPYVIAMAQASENPLTFLGITIEPAAIFPFAASLSVLLQLPFLPILGTIADYTHLKKRMMMAFAYTGAVATIALVFMRVDLAVVGTNGAVILASLLLIIANLCFGAAVVFYNAFLPEIVSPDLRDKVSSRGFAMGYLGGGLLLLINLAMLTLMEDTALAVRLSLASAGVWWLLFTLLFPQRQLKQREAARQLPEGSRILTHGVKQIVATAKEIYRKYPHTLRYLIAFLLYNDGIQTVIIVSAQFASDELGVAAESLLLLILMIQFVAIFGALGFGRLALYIGAKKAIIISLVVWSLIVIVAYALLYEEWQLFVIGLFIALVLGGSQALSRSLFSQMIPPDHEAEYFGFYEISERSSSLVGPFIFALAVQLTGTQRLAIVSLIIFFIVGLVLLARVNVRQAIVDAGNDPQGVVL